MDVLFNIFLVLHFVGLASLLGGVIVQASSAEKGVNPAMLHGALTQLVTGAVMVGLIESGAMGDVDKADLNMTKITVKLLVVLVITALAFVGRRRTPPQTGLWATIGVLTLANVVIAVFW